MPSYYPDYPLRDLKADFLKDGRRNAGVQMLCPHCRSLGRKDHWITIYFTNYGGLWTEAGGGTIETLTINGKEPGAPRSYFAQRACGAHFEVTDGVVKLC